MNYNKRINIIILLISIMFSQQELLLNNPKLNFEDEEIEQVFSHDEIFILANQISPDDYILGPGDQIGLSIITNENITLSIVITPTGDLFVPSVGIIQVGGLTISQAQTKVENFIHTNTFPKASISLALNNIREFKVKVLGGVNKPGYVNITSDQRLYDLIDAADGLHRDANEEEILVKRNNGNKEIFSLKYFTQNLDESQNPKINLGDVIYVPFENINKSTVEKIITSKNNPINVTGYTHKPGEYPYYFGYSIIDYINMAGGALDRGSVKKVQVYRQGKIIYPQLSDYAKPGDQLYIPPNTRYKIFGNSSFVTTTTAVLSLYLTFSAATNK